MTGFIIFGAIVACLGLMVLVTGLRTPAGQPKRAAMMIGGMMVAAFGLILGSFAIAWQLAAPIDLNAGAAK